MRCIPRPCAQRNLLLPRRVSLSLSSSRPPSRSPLLRWRMDLRNSPARRLREAFPVPLFSLNQTGRCGVPRIIRSIHQSGDQSAMARCECCMQRGLAIVAPVGSASSVKNLRLPSKRDGSAWCIGRSLHIHQSQVSPHLHQGNLHLQRFLILCVFRDWQRRSHRRELVKLLRHQRVDVRVAEMPSPAQSPPARPLSRAERAHWRLSWAQRLARNAASPVSSSVSITLFGIPDAFAESIGLKQA